MDFCFGFKELSGFITLEMYIVGDSHLLYGKAFDSFLSLEFMLKLCFLEGCFLLNPLVRYRRMERGIIPCVNTFLMRLFS